MPNFTQFQNDQPILKPITVADESRGKENIAGVMGDVANKFLKRAETVAEEESNFMLMKATRQASQMKNQAQIDLLINPHNAGKIVQDAEQKADVIKSNTPVNRSDRAKLEYLTDGDVDSVKLDAAKAMIKQNKMFLSLQALSGVKSDLKEYNETLANDPKRAEIFLESRMQFYSNAFSIGAISERTFANILNSFGLATDRHHRIVDLHLNENATAKDYHKAMGNPLDENQTKNSEHPVDENTAWQAKHHVEDMTERGLSSSVLKGQFPNQLALQISPENTFNRVILEVEGANEANARINSGSTLPELRARYNELQRSSSSSLNYRELAERSVYENYFKRLDAGDYQGAMEHTALGSKAADEYHTVANAIETNQPVMPGLAKYKSDGGKAFGVEDRKDMHQWNDNNFAKKMISVGLAKGIPGNQIHPLPDAMMQTAKSSFQLDQDPDNLINVLQHYDDDVRPYIANGMKNPLQQEAAYLVGQSLSTDIANTQEGFRREVIIANQEGRTFPNLKVEDLNTNDKKLRAYALVQGSHIFQFITWQSPDGVTRTDSLANVVVNKTKYDSERRNDFAMNKYKDLINENLREIAKTYNVVSGNQYAYNSAQVNMNKQQADILFASQFRHLEKSYEEHANAYQEAIDHKSLFAVITADNMIVIKDIDGHVLQSMPWTENLVAHALSEQKKIEKNAENLIKEIEKNIGLPSSRVGKLHEKFRSKSEEIQQHKPLGLGSVKNAIKKVAAGAAQALRNEGTSAVNLASKKDTEE